MFMGTDLVTDFRRAMVEALPTRGSGERDAFAALDAREQAWRFLNWQSRLVHAHPRRVTRAAGLDASSAFQAHRAKVELLLARFAAGVNVEPHLSRGTREGYCLHSSGRKHGPDFDLLLNEWGIHHLHLSSEPDGDGFNKRGDDLLFAIVLPGAVYAIAVGTHRDWTAPKLVEEVIRSWPGEQFFVSLGIEQERGPTPEEHLKLRKAGLTTPAAMGEIMHICRLTGGLTTALVAMATSQEAERLLRAVSETSRDPSGALVRLRMEAKQVGLRWPRRPRLHIVRGSAPQQWAFGLLEEASGATLMI